jgi:hypothetical protein
MPSPHFIVRLAAFAALQQLRVPYKQFTATSPPATKGDRAAEYVDVLGPVAYFRNRND